MRILFLLCLLLAACSGARDQPYWLINTDLKCDAVIVTGSWPIIDPVMAYSVCEDRAGHLYLPNGLVPNTTVATAGGLVTGMVQQASQIGAMMGGF